MLARDHATMSNGSSSSLFAWLTNTLQRYSCSRTISRHTRTRKTSLSIVHRATLFAPHPKSRSPPGSHTRPDPNPHPRACFLAIA